MNDTVARMRAAIHLESAAIAPQTSALIEAAKAGIEEIERLNHMERRGRRLVILMAICGLVAVAWAMLAG